VSSLDFSSVGQIFEAMDLYSRAVCRLAALRREPGALSAARKANDDFALSAQRNDFRQMGEANWRFHYELGRASGNSYVADAQTRMMTETMRFAYLAHYSAVQRNKNYRAYFDRITSEHDQILENVVAGRPHEAEELARTHILLFQQTIAELVTQNDLSDISVGAGQSNPR
jgi:DNA-binding GntR family transcriptional regulator